MGLILLDQSRRIETCLGKLVSDFPTGEDAIDAIPLLTGITSVFEDIEDGRRPSFLLPRLAWNDGPLADTIVSIEIMPRETPGRLQILVRDETEIANLERSVLQQRNELALLNADLTEAKERAEDALCEKAAFLANVSHDLKTPLQVIMGNAEILRDDLVSDEQRRFLQDILNNSQYLLALITDLLDASALEAGQMKLVDDEIDVRTLIERVLSIARQLPDLGPRSIDLIMESGERWTIQADPMRLQRLLLNLVQNAIKFTGNDGHITLSARADDYGRLTIDVEDNGCGIEVQLLNRAFEPFTTSGAKEGSGLGLHIAKGIADLHDADLSLSSEPGVGTTVTLSLPKARVRRVSA